ncbi:uncharacterized protein LOC115320636 isoform X1 [Ixodes scapularis]|uniref:uncharacterized protein LOC115320636 isoform X1 n=1 Tax=Ixodes scapularis TaxID=6945 RepID=UPI001A9D2903|nr:uncharacterized protein LOC115320636 isoform X1 [Ixodes scapularis]
MADCVQRGLGGVPAGVPSSTGSSSLNGTRVYPDGVVWDGPLIQRVATLSVIMLFTLVGNSTVLVVLSRPRVAKRASRVNLFIFNLALGDLAVCLFTQSSEMLFEVGLRQLGAGRCGLQGHRVPADRDPGLDHVHPDLDELRPVHGHLQAPRVQVGPQAGPLHGRRLLGHGLRLCHSAALHLRPGSDGRDGVRSAPPGVPERGLHAPLAAAALLQLAHTLHPGRAGPAHLRLLPEPAEGRVGGIRRHRGHAGQGQWQRGYGATALYPGRTLTVACASQDAQTDGLHHRQLRALLDPVLRRPQRPHPQSLLHQGPPGGHRVRRDAGPAQQRRQPGLLRPLQLPHPSRTAGHHSSLQKTQRPWARARVHDAQGRQRLHHVNVCSRSVLGRLLSRAALEDNGLHRCGKVDHQRGHCCGLKV